MDNKLMEQYRAGIIGIAALTEAKTDKKSRIKALRKQLNKIKGEHMPWADLPQWWAEHLGVTKSTRKNDTAPIKGMNFFLDKYEKGTDEALTEEQLTEMTVSQAVKHIKSRMKEFGLPATKTMTIDKNKEGYPVIGFIYKDHNDMTAAITQLYAHSKEIDIDRRYHKTGFQIIIKNAIKTLNLSGLKNLSESTILETITNDVDKAIKAIENAKSGYSIIVNNSTQGPTKTFNTKQKQDAIDYIKARAKNKKTWFLNIYN